MIEKAVIKLIEKELSINITGTVPVGGGSVNKAYCLHTDAKKYFIKINSAGEFPGMFEAEAAGLNLIAQSATIAVPEILLKGEVTGESFLLLEWIDSQQPTASASQKLGMQLAQMHRHSSEFFGLDKNNYMGSLHQSNKKHSTWSDFFVNERLQPMIKLAADKQLLNAKDIADFELLCKKLPGLFTEEPSSLLHGDLWGGNYLVSDKGTPYLIDPAVSYGNREFDIATTTLFGGFSREFYTSYHEQFPLNKGWEQRIDLWNIYPLLVHLNLFGMGYLAQVKHCLRRYL